MKGLTIFLVCVCVHTGNNYAQQPPYKTWYAKAEKLFNLDNPTKRTDSLAASLYLKAFEAAYADTNGNISLQCLIKTATIRQTYGLYDEAADLYRKSIDINRRQFKDSSLLYHAMLYAGTAYYQLGVTDSAKYYFEHASAISLDDKYESRFPEQERLYNSLGAIYYEIANYQQAINYFEKAKQYAASDRETLATLESNIANCLVQLRRFDDAIRKFRLLLSQKYLPRSLYHNTGHAYFKTGNYDSALYFFRRVDSKDDWITVSMMNDVGRIYTTGKQYLQAHAILDSALNICNRLAGNSKNRDRALNFMNRAVLADSLRSHTESLNWCSRAVNELYVYDNINVASAADESQCLSPVIVLQVLKLKSSLLDKYFAETGGISFLRESFTTRLRAIHVAGYIRRWLDNDEAKMFFQGDHSGIYHDAMNTAYALWQRNDSLASVQNIVTILEEYKGNVLYESIREALAKSALHLPEQAKEKSLKESLSYYTIQLGNSPSLKEAGLLKLKILDAQVQLSRLRRQSEEHHAYDFLREERNINDFVSKLEQFSSQRAIVNFMAAPDAVYTFIMAGDRPHLHKIAIDTGLITTYKNYVREIYDHREGRRYQGQLESRTLYEVLVKPIEKAAGAFDTWVFMTDGFLNYVPFESLTCSDDSRDYLVYHHALSYHYSISLLLDHMPSKPADNRNVLFFAPFAAGTQQSAVLSPLPFSSDEVPLHNIIKYTGAAATRQRFLKELNRGSIIHLATHASSADTAKNAMIRFYPTQNGAADNLYLNEIYSLTLNNPTLVILSACETAAGKNASGEGLLSLSRAFMYAGSQGILSTLWKSEDKVTAKLMQYFYASLEEGYSVEQALQKAKMQFLEDDDISEKFKTPNYWSNFIYVGSVGNVKNGSFRVDVLFTTMMCMLILVAIRKMTKRKRYPNIRG